MHQGAGRRGSSLTGPAGSTSLVSPGQTMTWSVSRSCRLRLVVAAPAGQLGEDRARRCDGPGPATRSRSARLGRVPRTKQWVNRLNGKDSPPKELVEHQQRLRSAPTATCTKCPCGRKDRPAAPPRAVSPTSLSSASGSGSSVRPRFPPRPARAQPVGERLHGPRPARSSRAGPASSPPACSLPSSANDRRAEENVGGVLVVEVVVEVLHQTQQVVAPAADDRTGPGRSQWT